MVAIRSNKVHSLRCSILRKWTDIDDAGFRLKQHRLRVQAEPTILRA